METTKKDIIEVLHVYIFAKYVYRSFGKLCVRIIYSKRGKRNFASNLKL